MSAIIPIPKIPISVRPATMDDLAFIDALQKKHTKQVGWMPTKQLEGKVKAGHVLIAEEGSGVRAQGSAKCELNSALSPDPCPLTPSPVGYCIGHDQYFKRDDVGIIYQMNVVPNRQRGLIGATLLKAMFDRAAYGCRLFCLWCAQDIEANYFWESLGFVPLAFRAGSAKKSRVHIFWQRRIRQDDTSTPYWFPSQTTGGSIREDRLVFPIPPGKKWSDEMPRILPDKSDEDSGLRTESKTRALSGPNSRTQSSALSPRHSTYAISRSKLHFAMPQAAPAPKEKPPREKRKAVKNDPRLVAAARELRDRWLERVNSGDCLLEASGKYDVSKALVGARPNPMPAQIPALPHAIAA